jgi:hypothetical protein
VEYDVNGRNRVGSTFVWGYIHGLSIKVAIVSDGHLVSRGVRIPTLNCNFRNFDRVQSRENICLLDVLDSPEQPMSTSTNMSFSPRLFLHIIRNLKTTPRTGWVNHSIPNPGPPTLSTS